MMRCSVALQVVLACIATLSVAHPGDTHSEEVDHALSKFKDAIRRSVGACNSNHEQRGLAARNVARREAALWEHRRQRGITGTPRPKRGPPPLQLNPDIVNDTSHLSNDNYTSTTPEDVIFPSSVCALSPEGETGPYYIPGELLRSDILEDEPGVPLYLEIQLIDVNTCEPAAAQYIDLWSCNATGVYSGVVGEGNGNANDTSNAQATFLRGISATDDNGVASFQTLFPGHYSGRTNHVHLAAHLNATVLPNNTLTGGTYDHVGQLFWDQDLIAEVEASYPYTLNTISQTKNVDDGVFITESENTTLGPVAEYTFLGSDLSDGLFAWITIGINTTATDDPNWSYIWTANGTVSSVNGENTGSPGWSQVGDWD